MGNDWPKGIDPLTFVSAAPIIEAVRVTEENLVVLAEWLGADTYTISHDIKKDVKKVEFAKIREDNPTRPQQIVQSVIGGFIVRHPEGVDIYGDPRPVYFYSMTQQDIDRFIHQTVDHGRADIDPPYYR